MGDWLGNRCRAVGRAQPRAVALFAVMPQIQEVEEKSERAGFLDPRNKRPAVPHGVSSIFRQWEAEQGFPAAWSNSRWPITSVLFKGGLALSLMTLESRVWAGSGTIRASACRPRMPSWLRPEVRLGPVEAQQAVAQKPRSPNEVEQPQPGVPYESRSPTNAAAAQHPAQESVGRQGMARDVAQRGKA
jgi:hypothetical protein